MITTQKQIEPLKQIEPSRLIGFIDLPVIRQFLKFGAVGLSSAVVNFICFNLLYHKAGASLLSASAIAFLAATINAFWWNRLWTFSGTTVKSLHFQSLQFLFVNSLGWLFNVSIVVLVLLHSSSNAGSTTSPSETWRNVFRTASSVMTGQSRHHYSFWQVNEALALATVIVTFWNFFVNRFWTFRQQS